MNRNEIAPWLALVMFGFAIGIMALGVYSMATRPARLHSRLEVDAEMACRRCCQLGAGGGL